jgi:hypothetical protein
MTGNLRLKASPKSTQPFTAYELRGTIRVLKHKFHDPSAIAPFQTGSLLSPAQCAYPKSSSTNFSGNATGSWPTILHG